MKILAVDVGTGTQDIFFYDSRLDLENGFKLIMPSPTMIVNRRLREATKRKDPVLLSGVTMGGGPAAWAVEAHLKAGLPVYATSDAARTLNDDLEAVTALGVKLVSQDEARRLPEAVIRLRMADFDPIALRYALAPFGLTLHGLDAIGIAVFDHGAAPAGVSDRRFRFDYLDERIRAENRLSAFAYPADRIPPSMTRLQAVAKSASEIPSSLVVMDTAAAAVLGATLDPMIAQHKRNLIVNVGNFHTLAFRLGEDGIEGVFEHHTGFLNPPRLEELLRGLAAGTLTNAAVYNDNGHGALVYAGSPLALDREDFSLVVTGPRRAMLKGSALKPYFAVPFGDMMIAGCFGLLAAIADVIPELAETLRASLAGAGGAGTPPWEVE
ncbi:uncharacterized protein conserved in archaea [Longilinea arvoryzae]|uniref:Uncharacterized protein conserved in archaea n=1 Tax=Longilinea arvoryzae TaxID=360412 RepID=A0A0S7B9S3_9CHLR|nr:DUF1786 domain-containing protein [Longilinea arvoryzae]GAP14167.1 uncharacterized protein conserved in archaea [Longilinea arvoryzae]